MADDGLTLVTGAAGQVGSVGRTLTGLLLERGVRVRAMVRRQDERAELLRAAGAEVVIGDLLDFTRGRLGGGVAPVGRWAKSPPARRRHPLRRGQPHRIVLSPTHGMC